MDNITDATAVIEEPAVILHPVIFFLMWFNVLLTGGFNLITIIAYLSSKEIRNNPGNIYIINLALADAMVGFITLPFNTLWWHYGTWPYGEIACKFWMLIDYTSTVQSLTAIIMISCDRLWFMSSITTYRRHQTTRIAIIITLATWIFWYIYFILIIAFDERAVSANHIDYSNDCDLLLNRLSSYTICEIVTFYIVPVFIIICINLRIYILIRRRLNTSRSANALRNRKAAITLAILVIAFLICWTPYHVVLWIEVNEENSVPTPVVAFADFLLWLNSTVNPFVYVCTNPLFRKQLKKMFCCCTQLRKYFVSSNGQVKKRSTSNPHSVGSNTSTNM